MSEITEKIDELRKETTFKGNRLLDELIDLLIKELEKSVVILKGGEAQNGWKHRVRLST